jgi:hypothetical protein
MVAAVGVLVSVIGTIASASAAKSKADFERAQFEEQAKLARIQAKQQEVLQMEEADRIRRANVTAQGGSGATAGSRSFLAVQKRNRSNLTRDIEAIRLNMGNQARKFDLSAGQARIAGSSAIAGGAIGVASSVAKSGVFKSGSTGSGLVKTPPLAFGRPS